MRPYPRPDGGRGLTPGDQRIRQKAQRGGVGVLRRGEVAMADDYFEQFAHGDRATLGVGSLQALFPAGDRVREDIVEQLLNEALLGLEVIVERAGVLGARQLQDFPHTHPVRASFGHQGACDDLQARTGVTGQASTSISSLAGAIRHDCTLLASTAEFSTLQRDARFVCTAL